MNPEEREEIARRARAQGIAGRLISSPGGDRYTPEEELNLIYDACDIGANTAMGEGWGSVSFEPRSCER